MFMWSFGPLTLSDVLGVPMLTGHRLAQDADAIQDAVGAPKLKQYLLGGIGLFRWLLLQCPVSGFRLFRFRRWRPFLALAAASQVTRNMSRGLANLPRGSLLPHRAARNAESSVWDLTHISLGCACPRTSSKAQDPKHTVLSLPRPYLWVLLGPPK